MWGERRERMKRGPRKKGRRERMKKRGSKEKGRIREIVCQEGEAEKKREKSRQDCVNRGRGRC